MIRSIGRRRSAGSLGREIANPDCLAVSLSLQRSGKTTRSEIVQGESCNEILD